MPNIAPEELSPTVEWALVSVPYLACHKDADYASPVIDSFRDGDILEVKGNCMIQVDDTKEKWFALNDGWVPSSAVKIYSNKLKAESAKKEDSASTGTKK